MTLDNISQKNERFPFQIAVGFFSLAALMGTLMRYIYLKEIPFLDYKHVLHAHSHLAMLGWGFTALAGALVFACLPKEASKKVYKNALFANLIAGIGMFFAFLYQGYGAVSIAFSTLHLVVAYYFAWHFLNDIKKRASSWAKTFARWSVYWMLISSLGLWAIAPVSLLLTKLHPLYFASIQFFLHFQFNGWFTYGILALLFVHSEKNGFHIRLPKVSFAILQISLLLTYTMSITWSTPENFLFYINSVGVLLQLLAFAMIWWGCSRSANFSFLRNGHVKGLFRVGILSLALKVLVQTAVAVPFIAQVSYTIRNFVIGFIHLTMLGAFSLTLIALLLIQQSLPTNKLAVNAYRLLLLGFISTEAILFLQGILLWAKKGFFPNYHELIFGATLLLPLALIMLSLSFFNQRSHKLKQS